MNILKIIICIVIVSLLLTAIQLIIVKIAIRKVTFDVQPWQKIQPNSLFKVLFAGDSSAVGRGLENNVFSVAGLFSHDFPQAHVENHSQNGLKLRGLGDILSRIQDKKFDLAILQIGGNDIMNFTSLDQIRRDHQRVLELTKNIAKKIVILHSGDIGEAKLFIWPFTWIFSWRSQKVRDIYMQRQDDRVVYIDILTRNKGVDLNDDYATDNIHLNAKGYALWYAYIKDELTRLKWLPLGVH